MSPVLNWNTANSEFSRRQISKFQDSQNETLITHYEKKKVRNQAKRFLL